MGLLQCQHLDCRANKKFKSMSMILFDSGNKEETQAIHKPIQIVFEKLCILTIHRRLLLKDFWIRCIFMAYGEIKHNP